MDFEFESLDAEVLASRRLELYTELQVLEFKMYKNNLC